MRKYVRCWIVTCVLLPLLLLAACTSSVPPLIAPTPTPANTLAGGGLCVHLGAHPQPPYSNIRVTDDSYAAHSETSLAQDPHNPLNLVGGAKFFPDVAHYRFNVGYAASLDGGCTWSKSRVLPGFDKDTRSSDPVFAFGPQHEVYAATIFINQHTSGVSVSVSRDRGLTFSKPTIVFEDKPDRVFSDKPWLAVDQTAGPASGNVYVVWSYDHGGDCGNGNTCSQNLAFSRSTDGGRTFSPTRQIEGKAPFCTNGSPAHPASATNCDAILGAVIVVEPDGTLEVAALYFNLIASHPVPTRILALSSPDAGITWTTPVLAATIHDIIGTFPPQKYRALSLPALASDPRTGQLYLTWSDKGTGDADVLLITSKDKGKTWSAPLRVNDDPVRNGAQQFQPQLAVSPQGIVTVSFFDTRNDPHRKLIDVYLAQSLNHAASFQKNIRVTSQGWDPTVQAPTDDDGKKFIGDYQGLAADATFVHVFWNDTRTGRQEIFTSAVPLTLSIPNDHPRSTGAA